MPRKAPANRNDRRALPSDLSSWAMAQPRLDSYLDTWLEEYNRLANHRPRGAAAIRRHAFEMVDLTMEVLEVIRTGFACLDDAHAHEALMGLLNYAHELTRYDTATALLRLGVVPDAWLRFSLRPDRETLIPAYAQCEVAALLFDGREGRSASGLPPEQTGKALNDRYRPADQFKKGMASRLRQAARRESKRVRTRTIDGVVCYSVADARQWWPNDVPK